MAASPGRDCQELSMKLTGIIPQIKADNKIQAKKSADSATKTEDTLSVAQADRVVLSAGTMEVQKAREVLAQTPAVRTERIQALQEQIARGEYRVDAHKIADKMMISLLSDHLSGE